MLIIRSILHVILASLFAVSITANKHQLPFHQHSNEHSSAMSQSLNVLKKPLALHSTRPLTGFLRNGYCETPPGDFGNHAVAAEVTDEFLAFSKRNGNDLTAAPVSLTGGCKWCLCASRWKEAFDARGELGDKVVPKIFLNATNESALKKIKLDDLKKFAVDNE